MLLVDFKLMISKAGLLLLYITLNVGLISDVFNKALIYLYEFLEAF